MKPFTSRSLLPRPTLYKRTNILVSLWRFYFISDYICLGRKSNVAGLLIVRLGINQFSSYSYPASIFVVRFGHAYAHVAPKLLCCLTVSEHSLWS